MENFITLDEATRSDLLGLATVKNYKFYRKGKPFYPKHVVLKKVDLHRNRMVFKVGDYDTVIKLRDYELLKGEDGYKVDKIKLALEGDIKVHCTCGDYQYRFLHILFKYGASTQRETRPPDKTNPNHEGGICKHLDYLLRNMDNFIPQISQRLKGQEVAPHIDDTDKEREKEKKRKIPKKIKKEPVLEPDDKLEPDDELDMDNKKNKFLREAGKSLENSLSSLNIEKYITEARTAPFIKEVSEGNNRRPLAAAVPSDMKQKLIDLYDSIRNSIDTTEFSVDFNQDHIRIACALEDTTSFSYNPFIASLVEHMAKEGKKVLPLPKIVIKKDLQESSSVFGKTAYYEPENKKVVLYTVGRHPKDVLRSLAHELIHHHQNLNGELDNLGGGTDTNNDEELRALEERTYAESNILFRNWEDKVKGKLK